MTLSFLDNSTVWVTLVGAYLVLQSINWFDQHRLKALGFILYVLQEKGKITDDDIINGFPSPYIHFVLEVLERDGESESTLITDDNILQYEHTVTRQGREALHKKFLSLR